MWLWEVNVRRTDRGCGYISVAWWLGVEVCGEGRVWGARWRGEGRPGERDAERRGLWAVVSRRERVWMDGEYLRATLRRHVKYVIEAAPKAVRVTPQGGQESVTRAMDQRTGGWQGAGWGTDQLPTPIRRIPSADPSSVGKAASFDTTQGLGTRDPTDIAIVRCVDDARPRDGGRADTHGRGRATATGSRARRATLPSAPASQVRRPLAADRRRSEGLNPRDWIRPRMVSLTRKRKLDAAPHDDQQQPVPAPDPRDDPHRPSPKRLRFDLDPHRRAPASKSALHTRHYALHRRTSLPAPTPTPVPSSSPVPTNSTPAPAPPVPPPPAPASLLSPQPESPVSPHVPHTRHPPFTPPISRDTLRELDLDAILRNPQLRHDLLFDPGLQFRPTGGRRKQLAAERYWAALARELEQPSPSSSDAPSSSSQRRPPTPPPWSPRCCLPQQPALRIPHMLQEFLAVLSSVIVPPPLAPVPPASADARSLLAHIDPELITQELRRGIFDPAGLFSIVGSTLKRHCAPMRDRLVDAMVACAAGQGEYAAESLVHRTLRTFRMCFEILELMKLDIANHQLQHLRPFLASSTPDFELRVFLDQCRRRGGGPPQTTRTWLQRALSTLPRPTPPQSRRTRIHLAIIHALCHLIFATGSPLPETLALDGTRVALLERDAADLSALYMLLLLWRQLAVAQRRRPPAAWEADRVKREIWEVGPRRLGSCFFVDEDDDEDEDDEDCENCGDYELNECSGEHERWVHAMQGVALQIARRAAPADEGDVGASSTSGNAGAAVPPPPPAPPSEGALALPRGWISTNLRRGSPLAVRLRALLRDEVIRAVVRITFGEGAAAATGEQQVAAEKREGGAAAATAAGMMNVGGDGLEPLQPEIRHLAGRLARLAGVNMRVYWSLYATDQFLADDCLGPDAPPSPPAQPPSQQQPPPPPRQDVT